MSPALFTQPQLFLLTCIIFTFKSYLLSQCGLSAQDTDHPLVYIQVFSYQYNFITEVETLYSDPAVNIILTGYGPWDDNELWFHHPHST